MNWLKGVVVRVGLPAVGAGLVTAAAIFVFAIVGAAASCCRSALRVEVDFCTAGWAETPGKGGSPLICAWSNEGDRAADSNAAAAMRRKCLFMFSELN